jgi:hypothetical protein
MLSLSALKPNNFKIAVSARWRHRFHFTSYRKTSLTCLKVTLDNRATQTFQTSTSHLKFPGTRRVTKSNAHSEAPQIFGATVSNFGTRISRHKRLTHPAGHVLCRNIGSRLGWPSSITNLLSKCLSQQNQQTFKWQSAQERDRPIAANLPTRLRIHSLFSL